MTTLTRRAKDALDDVLEDLTVLLLGRRHAVSEARLLDGDGDLRGRFSGDADLFRRELAGGAPEAEAADELTRREHGHYHVHKYAGCQQRVDLGAARLRRRVDDLDLSSP